MKPVIDDIVSHIDGPPESLRAEALAVPALPETHDRLVMRIPALQALEASAPLANSERPVRRIGAWNTERCKYLYESATLLDAAGVDVVLLSEMDHGMARSGNRHTARDLAARLGMGYLFATEFVELDLGDAREKAWHAGERNLHGLHGNAILSRVALRDPARVALDDGAVWFRPGTYQDQRRIGGRCAVTAIVDLATGPALLASLHLESHSSPEDRAVQVGRLLEAIEARHGAIPALIAGDLNTAALPRGADPDDRHQGWFVDPAPLEPLFELASSAGFRWSDCNTPGPTERTRPDGAPLPPFRRIDWMLARGIPLAAPRVWPAVDTRGTAISDHDLITADLGMEGLQQC